MDTDVRIVTLKPFRVAVANAYGPSPETEAIAEIFEYASKNGLLKPGVRFFGENNPYPSAGTPDYGYDMYMTVGPEAQPEGKIEMRDFPGGLYAVTHCPGDPSMLFAVWQKLEAWVKNSKYDLGPEQCLEEHLYEDVVRNGSAKLTGFDLYLGIKE